MPGETRNTRIADTADLDRVGINWRGLSNKLRTLSFVQVKRSFLASTALFSSAFANPVLATENQITAAIGNQVDQTSVLLLAVFGGAVSFALLSAFWLIRERARVSDENLEIKKSYAGIRADRDRLASLVEVNDQCIVVWDNNDSEPKIMGSLASESGSPGKKADFLAFGKWLDANSSMQLENAIALLKSEAKQFTLTLKTQNGTSIEAQGRVSGGYAFVRFIILEGARQELAKISTDHAALYGRFALIEELFERLPAPIWIKNADGKLAYANAAYSEAVEAVDSDTAVKENKQLFDQKERDQISESLKENGSFYSQLPVVVAGDRRTMETLSVATDKGACGIAIDRGDVEAVRATLKHAITSHEQTFDHLGTAIAIFDANQKLQFHNSSFQQLWGLNSSDLEDHPSNSHMLDTLRHLKKLPEQPDWKKWKEQQLNIYHSTETREENWHLPDGRTLRVIVNPQNQGGASWVFENVTEELALRSTYNSLVRVQGETLDHLNEAVAVFGSDGKVRLTNPAFQKLWQFEGPQDVEGFHVREISKKIRDAIKSKEVWESITLGITGVEDDRNDLSGRLELGSGAFFDYHLVFLPEGQSMLTLADMSAAVNIERALKERNDALEESDALKNKFIQHVSYELRAPLTSISGFAEILSSNAPGKLNEKQAEYLDYIAQSSDVLKALIDDILDLATIDAGAMELDLTKVRISEIVETCLGEQLPMMQRSQIVANSVIEQNAEELVADSQRLRKIISNLLSNAVKVSPDGGKIDVHVCRLEDALEISVSDQGPGISEEKQKTIFERFETIQGGSQKRGAGLGLSIVKSFTELHGGSVQVENLKERGARFICRLPVAPMNQQQAAE